MSGSLPAVPVVALGIMLAVAGQHAHSGPVEVFSSRGGPALWLLASSSGEAPPPFWEESFWGLTLAIERGFPFQLTLLGTYQITELQIAAYHYEQLAGSSGMFSVWSDLNNEPGELLGAFQLTGIGLEPAIIAAGPVTPFTLRSGERYWLVGTTAAGQVNWNLGDSSFGPGAYRVTGGLWVYLSQANISAFALLGTLSEAHVGDCNTDGQLEAGDWQGLSRCLRGPHEVAAPDCACADFNGDEFVDLRDVADLVPGFSL